MVASHTTGPWIDPWSEQSEHFLFLCSGGAFESVWAPPLIAQIAKALGDQVVQKKENYPALTGGWSGCPDGQLGFPGNPAAM